MAAELAFRQTNRCDRAALWRRCTISQNELGRSDTRTVAAEPHFANELAAIAPRVRRAVAAAHHFAKRTRPPAVGRASGTTCRARFKEG